jgi:hypothetical protein
LPREGRPSALPPGGLGPYCHRRPGSRLTV